MILMVFYLLMTLEFFAAESAAQQDILPTYASCVQVGARSRNFAGENEAIVRFMPMKGEFYQVRWDTYGVMYDGAVSAAAVLERNLLAGDEHGFFSFAPSKGELDQLLKGVFFFVCREGVALVMTEKICA